MERVHALIMERCATVHSMSTLDWTEHNDDVNHNHDSSIYTVTTHTLQMTFYSKTVNPLYNDIETA